MFPQLSRRGKYRLDNEISSPRHVVPGKYYDKEHNPEGTINLATAENSLMTPELLDYMHKHFKLTPAHLKYRTSIAKGFVQSTIDALPYYINKNSRPLVPVSSEHVVPGPGLGALLAQFFWAVCNEGDGVLLTTPYYDDYYRDIIYPARSKLIPAYVPATIDPLSPTVIEYIEHTIEESQAQGKHIRVLLLCNPHNPLARVYPRETILEYARIAEKYNLHLLVDEVFGNQVFPSKFVPEPEPFISILSLEISPLLCHPSRIHVLAGPTKDLGASGIKVGAFISQNNSEIIRLMTASLGPIPISSAADALITPILLDDVFREWFLAENKRRLTKAFEKVANWCTFQNIPFLPASAGVYFLLDLAAILDKLSPADYSLQLKLDAANLAMLQNGVFMRATTRSEDPIPTRFRMTFTLPPDTMNLALSRLEKAFGLPHWVDKV